MEKQNDSSGQGRYSYDDWVGQARPDPRNTDPLTLLQGFVGQSSENGHIRIYADETLNSFVEVPEDAIVYAQQLSQTESSLGGSRLWLRADAVIVYGDPKSANRPRSSFLEGDLMQQYGAFGNQAQASGFEGVITVNHQFCRSRTPVHCPQTRLCPQAGGLTGNQPATNELGATELVNCTFRCGQYTTIAGPHCPALSTDIGICPPYMGEAGAQPMATVAAIQCTQPINSVVCLFTQQPVNCPTFATRHRSVCSFATCFRTVCNPVTCLQTVCNVITRGINCPPTCIGVTRTLVTIGGCPSIAGCPSLVCGDITQTITPGTTVVHPGVGLGDQAGATAYMGGYYGTFNPYMM